MKAIIAALALTASYTAYAKDCNTHKVYCRILKLTPKIDKDRAMKLSNLIYREAKKYDIDPMISVAILKQENRFRDVHTYETSRDVIEECYETSCVKRVNELHEVVDIGVAQINVKTAVYNGFDLDRLYSHDLEYAIECHMFLLNKKMKLCKELGEEAWSCYHSKTPQFRTKYVEMVSRFLENDDG